MVMAVFYLFTEDARRYQSSLAVKSEYGTFDIKLKEFLRNQPTEIPFKATIGAIDIHPCSLSPFPFVRRRIPPSILFLLSL